MDLAAFHNSWQRGLAWLKLSRMVMVYACFEILSARLIYILGLPAHGAFPNS